MSDREQTVLKRLRVKNYRSLADIDLSLGRLTVLVGPNGAGKSTVIDVLRFVRNALTRDLDAAIVDGNGISSIRRWTPRGAADVRIEVELGGAQWSGEYSFTIGSEQRGAWRVKAEQLHISQATDLDGERRRFLGDDDTIAFQIRNGKLVGRARGLDYLEQQLPSLVSPTSLLLTQLRVLSLSTALYEFHQFFDATSFYTIYPDSLREPQRPGNDYPLDERGLNLGSVLRSLQRKQNQQVQHVLNDALARVVEGVQSYTVRQVGGFMVTRLQHDAAEPGTKGPVFDLSQESDGTRRMLGILTALYQEPPRSLLTLEEPELTIHLGALGVLCDVILEASARSQVITTTHSIDLIDRFPTDALRVVEKQGGITSVGPVSHKQREVIARHLFSPGELMRMEGLHRDSDLVERP